LLKTIYTYSILLYLPDGYYLNKYVKNPLKNKNRTKDDSLIIGISFANNYKQILKIHMNLINKIL